MRMYWNLYLSARGEVCTRTSTYLPLMNDDEFAVMETWSIKEIGMLDEYLNLLISILSPVRAEGDYWDYSERRRLLAKFEKQIKQKVRDQW